MRMARSVPAELEVERTRIKTFDFVAGMSGTQDTGCPLELIEGLRCDCFLQQRRPANDASRVSQTNDIADSSREGGWRGICRQLRVSFHVAGAWSLWRIFYRN